MYGLYTEQILLFSLILLYFFIHDITLYLKGFSFRKKTPYSFTTIVAAVLVKINLRWVIQLDECAKFF